MMSIIIDTNQMQYEDFTGASIYLDACFIITYLDKDDPRRGDVIEALSIWAEHSNTRLAISNHTVAEVINCLFHSLILTCIDTYHQNNFNINQRSSGYEQLSQTVKEKLIDLETSRFIYKVAKATQLLQIYNNRKSSANVNYLIKAIKDDYPTKRHFLDVFYNRVVDIFEGFYLNITQRLEIPIDILPSKEVDYHLFKVHMRLLQLDPTDALHLAIARLNQCKYFATLDIDFVNERYEKEEFDIHILKIS